MPAPFLPPRRQAIPLLKTLKPPFQPIQSGKEPLKLPLSRPKKESFPLNLNLPFLKNQLQAGSPGLSHCP
jgi:hypothetical protein